jgi:hypothetical protein
MREDMYKVIVERPRRGGGVQGEGRAFRNGAARCWKGVDNAPSHLGIKRGYGYGKGLNENLAPLKRWLGQQVNRPWDKVFSELSAHIDTRNTVQAHIYSHLDDMVQRHCVWRDEQVWVLGDRWSVRTLLPIRQSWHELYVHPRTGILLFNKHHAAGLAARYARPPSPPIDTVLRKDGHVLKQINGIWYALTLSTLPPVGDGHIRNFSRYDFVRDRMVSRLDKVNNRQLYGDPHSYAAEKRQLGGAQLRQLELENTLV